MKELPILRISRDGRTATKPDGTEITVIDSKETVFIQPSDEDIANSLRGDHTHCMYAMACRRMYHSDLVWVTRTVAYIEFRGRKGVHELRRFILKAPARENIKDFDAGKEVSPESVIFAAPVGRQRLGHMIPGKTKNNKKQAHVKTAVIPRKKARPFFSQYRESASGQFHFSGHRKFLIEQEKE